MTAKKQPTERQIFVVPVNNQSGVVRLERKPMDAVHADAEREFYASTVTSSNRRHFRVYWLFVRRTNAATVVNPGRFAVMLKNAGVSDDDVAELFFDEETTIVSSDYSGSTVVPVRFD